MLNNPGLLEIAQLAVTEAIRHGALYADVRLESTEQEQLIVENSRVRSATRGKDLGLGVRVLANGAWGFSSISDPSLHDSAVAARRAVEQAKASAILQLQPVSMIHESPHCGIFRTKIDRDPLSVPLDEKFEFLFEIDKALRGVNHISYSGSGLHLSRRQKLFLSSEGSELTQDLLTTSVNFTVGASNESGLQLISYPGGSGLSPQNLGWESIDQAKMLEKAQSCAVDAVDQLSGEACLQTTDNVVLGGAAMATLIRDICGPELELDRVLGTERNPEGLSVLTPEKLGTHEYGSKHISLYVDTTLDGAAGSLGYDDEGVEGQRSELVEEGRFSGYLSNRETARQLGLSRSSGCMRAGSWRSMPVIRATNLCLAPGDSGSVDSLIADTKSGIYIDGPCETSHDHESQGFQLFGAKAWKIKDGKLIGRVQNPSIRASSAHFWKNCDAVCGRDSWDIYGSYIDGKGRPNHTVQQSNGTSPARFTDVMIGLNKDLPLITDLDDSVFLAHAESHLVPKPKVSIHIEKPIEKRADDEVEPTVKPGISLPEESS